MAKHELETILSSLIEESVHAVSEQAIVKEPLPSKIEAKLENPKDMSHGDLTTNIAMRLTRFFTLDPMAVAKKVCSALEGLLENERLHDTIDKVAVHPPGYINIYFKKQFLFDNLKKIQKQRKRYGSRQAEAPQRIQIEFVSANPTGPLTIAHGRQAAVGDSLARILTFYGHAVKKEYFINDEGRQINLLGKSIIYRYLLLYGKEIPFPEDGYRGDYINDIAVRIKNKYGPRFIDPFVPLYGTQGQPRAISGIQAGVRRGVDNYDRAGKFFSRCGVKYIMRVIRRDLADFDVRFDTWFSQASLTRAKILNVLDMLRKKGFVYEKEGATWFTSSAYGDEKDRVVIKSDGAFTYFAPDIAYHMNKYRRRFGRLINIWGPDHHGYVPRLKAACRALGYGEDSVSVLLVQLATLYKDGKAVSMSTRMGEFVTLRQVMDEAGKDVAKFFFLMRKLDSHLDFDLDAAKKQSQDNPVYYIQYAHARIWSISDFARKNKKKIRSSKADLSLLEEPEELGLARYMFQFPKWAAIAAENLEPYYIILYLNCLARLFHDFYTKHRVITDDAELSSARFYLVDCVRVVLANGLRLLGVSLPKRM